MGAKPVRARRRPRGKQSSLTRVEEDRENVAPFRTEIRRPGSQVDGAYYCATSWEYSAAEIEDYGFDPGVHRGCIIEDGPWCEAADASGTYVGWCKCDPGSDDTTDAAARAGARASALAILAAFVFVLA